MSFGTTDTEITYTGNGVDTTFAIPFAFVDAASIKIQKFDVTDADNPVEIATTLNVDYTVTGTDVNLIEQVLVGMDLVPTPLALGADEILRVYRETVDTRSTNYTTYQFPYATVNTEMDRTWQRLQELRNELEKYIRLTEEQIAAGETLDAAAILESIQQLEEFLASGAGLPAGGADGDFVQKLGTTGEWKSGAYSGFSARFSEAFNSTSLDDTIRKILNFSYLAPLISLSSSPSQSVREKGTNVTAATLTATTTKRSDDITAVRFYRAGVLVETVGSPDVDGGTEQFVENTDFSDTMTFYAQVDDGTSTVQSNTVTYPFVYPYYYGSGAAGKTAAQVGALTKYVISSTASVNRTFTPSGGDVHYFAYPASYGALTSILDENNFETFSDWTLTTANITGLDASAVSYRIYEFNNAVVAGTTSYTFKR